MPLPTLDLKINLGGAIQIHPPAHPLQAVSYAESWCVGIWSTSHAVHWHPNTQIFGVNLKPVGAWALFNLPLYELHNQVIPLDALWGQFAAEVRERLAAALTMQARFALLEQLLLTRLRAMPYNAKWVQAAVAQIARAQGVLSIQSLSDQMGISQTHLATLFKQMVGALPKELARLYRFERVLHTVDVEHPVDWTQITYQCGYYDQAHFNKDFSALTGYSPTEYLRLRRQVSAEHPDHQRHYRNLPIL